MRKVSLALMMLAAAMLAMAGIAVASSQFKQTAKVTLTATKPNAPTGFKASIFSSDPGAPMGQPQALKLLVIAFPNGTEFNFNSKAIKLCKASDAEVVGTKGAVCPSKSKLGSGTATAMAMPVFPSIPETATVFAGANKELLVLVVPKAAGSTLVLHAKVTGGKLAVAIPKLEASGLKIVLVQLAVDVKTVGKGKNAFAKAGRCTKKKFIVTSRFLYENGETLSLKSTSKCK